MVAKGVKTGIYYGGGRKRTWSTADLVTIGVPRHIRDLSYQAARLIDKENPDMLALLNRLK